MIRKFTICISLFFCLALWANAQTNISGRIIDAESGTGLPGATIRLEGTEAGTTTDATGRFSLNSPQHKGRLIISYLGYNSISQSFSAASHQALDIGTLSLEAESIGIKGIDIISSYATERKTPVAISNIKAEAIEQQLGNQEYPEIMKMVPGIYATRQGGGSGDARLSLRGFQQENIALLLNGVPVSSTESGQVFWANWLGLGDATQSIQVQKGLAASRVAMNSVGGTINIITKTTEAQKGGSIKYAFSDYGNSKTTLRLSTGKMDNGYAVSFMGAHTTGPGYIDATAVDSWAYYLSISKDLNPRHKLRLTLLGAPETHGQRQSPLSEQEFKRYGNKYNKDWGSYQGKTLNLNQNFYHKPHLALNHYWTLSEKSFLATSAYISAGYGGGKWTETFNSPPVYSVRNAAGQIDWEALATINSTHTDSVELSNGQYAKGYSKYIRTNFLASHVWSGLLSTYTHDFNEHVKLIAGFHGRYVTSKLYEEVDDLLGGDYWIDDYAWAIDGPGARNQIKTVGDITRVNQGAANHSGSLFGQVEYSNGLYSAFLAGTVNNTWYQRKDHYNYLTDIKSKLVNQSGFDIKTGFNYNLNEFHNLFINAGYYSKAPYYNFIFVNFSNAVATDIRNEKIKAFELGYGYTKERLRIRLNAYYTLWEDRSILSNENIQLSDNSMTRALIRGLDALHKGVELETAYHALDWLEAGMIFTLGDWKWQNDVVAELYNDNNVLQGVTEVYANGLYVGDAPQTQLGLNTRIKVQPDLELIANWVYYDRLYANFEPDSRNNPNDRSQPWQIPAWSEIDVHLAYATRLFNQKAIFNISCFNLLDEVHILRGQDGPTHSRNDFVGFWSFGRNFNFSLKMQF